MQGLSLLLERTTEGERNWRFHPASPAPQRSAPPQAFRLRLRDSEVLFRTSSGSILASRVEEAVLQAEAADEPVTLRLQGSYNAVPVRLEARFGPQGAAPLPATLEALAGGDTTLRFTGTIGQPLDADGAEGQVTLEAPRLDTLLRLAGTALSVDAPVTLQAQASRQGDVWRLSDGQGRLREAAFILRQAQLTEGRPDALMLDIAFTTLDLNRLLAGHDAAPDAEVDLPLFVPREPDTVADIRLEAQRMAVGALRAEALVFAGSLTPGQLAVSELALTTAGARATATGLLQARGDGALLSAEAGLQAASIDNLRRAFGLRALPLNGPLQGRVVVTAEAQTANEAARKAHVIAALAMPRGRIAREVIELASLDLRRLLRRPEGDTPLTCLLAVLDMRAGRGELVPLRLRAATGSLAGAASINLPARQFDLVIGSDAATTGSLALDIPVRVHGSFADPAVGPARWSAEGRARLAAADAAGRLPPALRDFAAGNACRGPLR